MRLTIIGYARVSAQDQNPEFQIDALEKTGCEQIFQEKFTGKLRERPELSQRLRMFRKGDVLTVWSLDRLARPLKDPGPTRVSYLRRAGKV